LEEGEGERSWETTGARALARGAAETWHGTARDSGGAKTRKPRAPQEEHTENRSQEPPRRRRTLARKEKPLTAAWLWEEDESTEQKLTVAVRLLRRKSSGAHTESGGAHATQQNGMWPAAAQTLALGDETRTHGVAFSKDKSGPGRTN
jgi:hypothetical protein